MEYPISSKTQRIISELMKKNNVVEFMNGLGDLTAELIQTNKPWLADIESHISRLPDGVIHFQVKKFNGKVTEIVLTEVSKLKYK